VRNASTRNSGLCLRLKPIWYHASRILLGLLFVVSGADGFYFLATGENFIHPPTSPAAMAFEEALLATGFMWPLVKIMNLLGGASLLLSCKPAFGLAIIMPAITVITLFHLVLNPAGIAIAAVMDLTAATLAYAYRHQYAAMLA